MKNSIKLLYQIGKINKTGVRMAVLKNWITRNDYLEITGEKYSST